MAEARRYQKPLLPTCVELELGPVGAGVALQRGAVVQAGDGVGQALLRLLGLAQLVGPHQADGLEALGHHDELHPLSGQSHQAFLQGHQRWDAVILGWRRQDLDQCHHYQTIYMYNEGEGTPRTLGTTLGDYHGGLLDDRVVGLLQVAVQDVTQHAGRVLMKVAGSFGHSVVLAPDGDVDALFLRDKKRDSNIYAYIHLRVTWLDMKLTATDLQSLGHDAAHDGAHPQRAFHVQLAQRGLELVDGDQPGSDGRRGRAEQIQLPGNTRRRRIQFHLAAVDAQTYYLLLYSKLRRQVQNAVHSVLGAIIKLGLDVPVVIGLMS